MGKLSQVFGALFGSGNVIKDTVEVFRPNAEAQAQRIHDESTAVLDQYAREFAPRGRQSVFDSLIDGLNRIPRPAFALGIIALFLSAMFDPIWFAARMEGITLVPEPMWWLLGVVVSFYFGGRWQAKKHSFDVSSNLTLAPQVIENQRAYAALSQEIAATPGKAEVSEEEFQQGMAGSEPMTNDVILEWNRRNQRER